MATNTHAHLQSASMPAPIIEIDFFCEAETLTSSNTHVYTHTGEAHKDLP